MEQPWQLQVFHKALKKQQKLRALLSLIGDVDGQACLLVTCGDNNGALNWHFRAHGGQWLWADVAGENLREMTDFLGDPVQHAAPDHLPFDTGQFDWVVAIDVLEHLNDDQPFLGEIRRVLRTGGTAVVTVPNGDPGLLANRIKWRLGMSPEVYGHTRAGYTIPELSDSIRSAGMEPAASGGYSRFLTEMMELVVNFGYVFVLSRKQSGQPAGIAPTSSRELKTHGAAYRLYSAAFPVMNLISKLDAVLPESSNNAVIVTAVKNEVDA